MSKRLVTSSCLFTAILLGSFAWSLPRTAVGQDAPLVSSSRESLYQQLAADLAPIERQARVLKRVINLISPTVVHIEAEKQGGGSSESLEEAGSGIVIEYKDGFYVITNGHVIADSSPAAIKLRLHDGRTVHPTRVWSDVATDIAVLKIAGDRLVPSRLGDSDTVEMGDFVLAFGSPFGLSHSVTFGIVSAKGRRDLQLGSKAFKYQEFIQTDAAINPGNSGGPLLNLKGEVVGINTAIASSSGGNEGIGFSVPINMAMFVTKRLIDEGVVKRAFLGVTLDSSYSADEAFKLGLRRFEGARVSRVEPDSAAAAADIQTGDLLLEFDGVRIEDDNHLINRVGMTDVGKQVSVGVLRDGKPITVTVQVRHRE